MILNYEIDFLIVEFCGMVDQVYKMLDVGVLIVLGFFCMMGMLIVFCLVCIMLEIVVGVILSLLIWVVDVVFKERCWLVLMVCEIFYYFGYIWMMERLIEMGVIICFFLLVFYINFKFIDDIVDQFVGCVFDLFDLDWQDIWWWGEDFEKGCRGQLGGSDIEFFEFCLLDVYLYLEMGQIISFC